MGRRATGDGVRRKWVVMEVERVQLRTQDPGSASDRNYPAFLPPGVPRGVKILFSRLNWRDGPT